MRDKLLTDEHYRTFGYITSQYAKLEAGLRFFIAFRLGIPPHMSSVICAPYTARHFRNVIRAMLHLDPMDQAENDEIISLIGDFKRASRIRNAIAHNLWTSGTRPQSIKPMYARIQEDKFEAFGYDDDEPDYLLDELKAEAKKLETLHSRFVQFYDECGVSAFIRENTSETSEAK